MLVRNILIVVIVLSLTPALVIAGDEKQIVGIWRFEKEVDTLADGTEVAPGPAGGYQGLLVFTPGGRFVGQLVPRGRQWRIETVALDDLRDSLTATDANFGTYRLDTAARTLTYHPEGSLDPSLEGSDQVRGYKMSGDVLVLSGSWQYQGTKRHFAITWRRVE